MDTIATPVTLPLALFMKEQPRPPAFGEPLYTTFNLVGEILYTSFAEKRGCDDPSCTLCADRTWCCVCSVLYKQPSTGCPPLDLPPSSLLPPLPLVPVVAPPCAKLRLGTFMRNYSTKFYPYERTTLVPSLEALLFHLGVASAGATETLEHLYFQDANLQMLPLKTLGTNRTDGKWFLNRQEIHEMLVCNLFPQQVDCICAARQRMLMVFAQVHVPSSAACALCLCVLSDDNRTILLPCGHANFCR